MWYFVLGYWIGALAFHYFKGDPEYAGPFAVTLMATLISIGFLKV